MYESFLILSKVATAPQADESLGHLMSLERELPPLRMKAMSIRTDGRYSQNQLICLIEEAKTIDSELANWPQDLPDTYHFTRCPIESTTSSGASPTYSHSYNSPMKAMTWNHWRINRLRILFIITTFALMLDAPPDISDTDLSRYISMTEHLVEDIFSSVPYLLGSISANYRFQPTDNMYNFTPAQLVQVYAAWLVLRPIEVGSPVPFDSADEGCDKRPWKWNRSYIERYAKHPLFEL